MDARATVDATVPARLPQRRGDASRSAWPAIAAWGAALIHLALGAGAVTATDGLSLIGLPLIALGLAGLSWGCAVLVRGRAVVPCVAISGALVGIVAGAVALAIDPVRTSVVAVGAASVLLVAVAFGCGRALRRTGWETDAAPPRLVGLFIAAVVVAGIVTPALGATEAGRLAGHSGHGVVLQDEHSH